MSTWADVDRAVTPTVTITADVHSRSRSLLVDKNGRVLHRLHLRGPGSGGDDDDRVGTLIVEHSSIPRLIEELEDVHAEHEHFEAVGR